MKFKEFLQSKGISEEAFGKMEANEQAKLHGEFLDKMAETISGTAKASDLDGISKQIEELKGKGVDPTAIKTLEDALKELKATVEEQGKRIVEQSKITETGKMETLESVFKAKYDEAVEKSEANDGFDFRVKDGFKIDTSKATISTDVMSVDAVNSTDFPTAGSTSVVPAGLRTLYGKVVGFFGARIPESRIMDLVDVQPLDSGMLVAINETVVGSVAVTPECTLKPVVKLTFAVQEKSADPVAAQWHTTTKLRRFFAALVNRMEQKFADLVNKGIPTVVLEAIDENASAFTPNAALAINSNPNNYDAIGAVIASLENLGYIPNSIVMNPIAWRNMKQEKNADGVYTLSNGQSIQLVANGLDWGGTVIPYVKDPKLGIDEFIIGDLFETVKVGVDSQLMYFETDGRTDAQATNSLTGLSKNIRTHVLEKFVSVIVPDGSKAGIVKDTFANVKTLITATP